VLAPGDGHGLPGGQRGAQAVGAGHRLVPVAAGDDAAVVAVAAAVEAAVGLQVQDHAVGVGKGQQVVAAGDLPRQRHQFGLGQAEHGLGAVAAPRQLGGLHHRHAHRRAGVQAVVQAARPAVQHQRGRWRLGGQPGAALGQRVGSCQVARRVAERVGRAHGGSLRGRAGQTPAASIWDSGARRLYRTAPSLLCPGAITPWESHTNDWGVH
jgi:hypothetical protein